MYDLSILPGKDGKIYVFRLLDFEGESNENMVRCKIDCKDHKIEKTKGNVYLPLVYGHQ